METAKKRVYTAASDNFYMEIWLHEHYYPLAYSWTPSQLDQRCFSNAGTNLSIPVQNETYFHNLILHSNYYKKKGRKQQLQLDE